MNKIYLIAAATLLAIFAILSTEIDVKLKGPVYGFSSKNPDYIQSVFDEYSEKCSESLDKAEKLYLSGPDLDDEVLGEHPDVNKCICRGTGIVTHGDGHTTPCRYHGKKRSIVVEEVKSESKPCGEDCTCGDDCQCTTNKECLTEDNKEKELSSILKNALCKIDDLEKNIKSLQEKKEIVKIEKQENSIDNQIVILTSEFCDPCKEMLSEIIPALKKMGYIVSDSPNADIRILLAEKYPQIHKDIEVAVIHYCQTNDIEYETGYPTIIHIVNSKIVNVGLRAISLEKFIEEYNLEK